MISACVSSSQRTCGRPRQRLGGSIPLISTIVSFPNSLDTVFIALILESNKFPNCRGWPDRPEVTRSRPMTERPVEFAPERHGFRKRGRSRSDRDPGRRGAAPGKIIRKRNLRTILLVAGSALALVGGRIFRLAVLDRRPLPGVDRRRLCPGRQHHDRAEGLGLYRRGAGRRQRAGQGRADPGPDRRPRFPGRARSGQG